MLISDDWIEKKTCEILNRLASDYKADTVIFGLNFVFDSGKVIRSKRGMAGLTDKNMCMKYLIHNVARGGIFNYACNKMFSSHLFEGLRFPVGRLAEDQDVIYKLIHRSQRIYVTEQPLYNYYQRDGSITAAQYYPRLIRDRHELWLKRLDFIREYYPDLENYQIAQILGAAYVGIVKLEGNKQNGELKKKLICFSNKYILKEKELSVLDRKIKLHYYCYPLFWLYVKTIYKMNIAVIIAGGSGQRMGQDIPKQFINVYDKPVIIYTLEGFQRHPQIDAIEVVCIDGWHDVLWAYAHQFNITKLKWVISGGNTGQESIRNGVFNLEGKVGDEDIIVIHDGIRPLVDETVLTDVIMKAQIHGNAVTSLPYNEQIFVVNPENEKTTKQYIPREILRRVSTPQAYKFGKLDWAYHEAFEKEIGIKGSAYTNTMMVELGETLYFAAGSDKNN